MCLSGKPGGTGSGTVCAPRQLVAKRLPLLLRSPHRGERIGLDSQPYKPIRLSAILPQITLRSWMKCFGHGDLTTSRSSRSANAFGKQFLFSLGNHTRPAESKLSRALSRERSTGTQKDFQNDHSSFQMILGFGVLWGRHCPGSTFFTGKPLTEQANKFVSVGPYARSRQNTRSGFTLPLCQNLDNGLEASLAIGSFCWEVAGSHSSSWFTAFGIKHRRP